MHGSTDRQTEVSSQLSGGGRGVEMRGVIGRERERGGKMVMIERRSRKWEKKRLG